MIPERINFENFSGGLFCPLFFPDVEIFEIAYRWRFWNQRTPLSIYNMIDYDVFAKFRTKDCKR
jgi:hypothetical protein